MVKFKACILAAGLIVAATAQCAAESPLRGVMLPLRPCTEDDFRTLHEWGATLARYQMSRHFFLAIGKNRDLEEYDLSLIHI